MAMHWNVNCDGCGNTNLVHFRYKCLRCPDYDLCQVCYDNEVESGAHKNTHAFQCLLDRAARELFFAGEPISNLCADSYTCPICGAMGHTNKELIKHVQKKHSNDMALVICPLCVSVPSAHPDRVANINHHLTTAHDTDNMRTGCMTMTSGALPQVMESAQDAPSFSGIRIGFSASQAPQHSSPVSPARNLHVTFGDNRYIDGGDGDGPNAD
ncbi:E3 ubiquitin-protein ligase KCMF1 [Scaptodrosophila lebanonensis]|uniref:E3 ubiquitin-protein ligase KCMF1 n=1 Tax=Drosophila lebanonensis TaxID=7225 RepID=A0A6J2UDS5_DROLE|nr:E3 ubiquitin-protein ligase KCMF1 [Scaptodrosophila lebanonensis]